MGGGAIDRTGAGQLGGTKTFGGPTMEDTSMRTRGKTVTLQILIVVIALATAKFEPGLTVFAIGGAVAAWILVGNAGKARTSGGESPHDRPKA